MATGDRIEVMCHRDGHCYLVRYRRGDESRAYAAVRLFHVAGDLPLSDMLKIFLAIEHEREGSGLRWTT